MKLKKTNNCFPICTKIIFGENCIALGNIPSYLLRSIPSACINLSKTLLSSKMLYDKYNYGGSHYMPQLPHHVSYNHKGKILKHLHLSIYLTIKTLYSFSYLLNKQFQLLQHGIFPTNYLRINICSIVWCSHILQHCSNNLPRWINHWNLSSKFRAP